MDKKPEVDGSWVETSLDKFHSEISKASSASVLILDGVRVELSGADLDAFLIKYGMISNEIGNRIEEMTPEQKSFYIFRRMLLS